MQDHFRGQKEPTSPQGATMADTKSCNPFTREIRAIRGSTRVSKKDILENLSERLTR